MNILRIVARLFWLFAECVRATIVLPANSSRAHWLQDACRRTLRVFNIDLTVQGEIPIHGLLVSNHLSYLDIPVFGSLAQTTFVAKREVRSWPVFGWFARLAGTVFVDRARRRDIARSAAQIRETIQRGALVVLFAEGTSSGGDTVLPFKSSLLVPVDPLTAACLDYGLDEGNVADEVCYWRDMTFVPHLLRLLGKRGVSARVCFKQVQNPHGDRKALARQLHAEVVRLKEVSNVSSQPLSRPTISYDRHAHACG